MHFSANPGKLDLCLVLKSLTLSNAKFSLHFDSRISLENSVKQALRVFSEHTPERIVSSEKR
jgi:hypothetical protein